MIQVDDRTGSRELAKHIPGSEIQRLESADVCFWGEGEDGPVFIGIERKTIQDFVNSIESGRLWGHQIPGMVDDYHVRYLLLEGLWKINSQTHDVEVLHGREWRGLRGRNWSGKALIGALVSITEMAGFRVVLSNTMPETAYIIRSLHAWWTKKWDDHRSPATLHLARESDCMVLRKPGMMVRMAAQLKGVGWKRARAVAKHFSSPMDMVLATEEDWRQIEGIGKVMAERITRQLQTGKE